MNWLQRFQSALQGAFVGMTNLPDPEQDTVGFMNSITTVSTLLWRTSEDFQKFFSISNRVVKILTWWRVSKIPVTQGGLVHEDGTVEVLIGNYSWDMLERIQRINLAEETCYTLEAVKKLAKEKDIDLGYVHTICATYSFEDPSKRVAPMPHTEEERQGEYTEICIGCAEAVASLIPDQQVWLTDIVPEKENAEEGPTTEDVRRWHYNYKPRKSCVVCTGGW